MKPLCTCRSSRRCSVSIAPSIATYPNTKTSQPPTPIVSKAASSSAHDRKGSWRSIVEMSSEIDVRPPSKRTVFANVPKSVRCVQPHVTVSPSSETSSHPSDDHSPRATDQYRHAYSTSHWSPIHPVSHTHAPSPEQLPRPEHCTGTASHIASCIVRLALSSSIVALHASHSRSTDANPHTRALPTPSHRAFSATSASSVALAPSRHSWPGSGSQLPPKPVVLAGGETAKLMSTGVLRLLTLSVVAPCRSESVVMLDATPEKQLASSPSQHSDAALLA